MATIYTIGHSTHSFKEFIELLSINNIEAVCDVRSTPYSKFAPQFNRDVIKQQLKTHKIVYVFLGNELGPRSDDLGCYENGQLRYDRLAETDIFREGISRLIKGSQSYRIAIMCSEKDPIMCHRMILICRHLRQKNFEIKHILEDGSIESNRNSEQRLMKTLKIPDRTLFETREELLERAYNVQGKRIAYKPKEDEGTVSA